MKRVAIIVLTVGTLLFTGCGGPDEKQTDLEVKDTTTVTTTSEPSSEPTSEPTSEVSSGTDASESKQDEVNKDQDGVKTYVNKEVGYRITYDPELFEMEEDEDTARFMLIGQDLEKEVPTFISIRDSEYTATDTIEGLRLQAEDKTDVHVDESTMGEGSYESTSISYVDEDERGIQYNFFHVIDKNDTVYIIEIGDNYDENIKVQSAIEEMMASFHIL